jgi:hypothetical protein
MTLMGAGVQVSFNGGKTWSPRITGLGPVTPNQAASKAGQMKLAIHSTPTSHVVYLVVTFVRTIFVYYLLKYK